MARKKKDSTSGEVMQDSDIGSLGSSISMLVSCIKLLPASQAILIRGRHGIGKSEIVKQIGSELGMEVIDRRLSQVTEGEICGLPFKTKRNDAVYTDKEGNTKESEFPSATAFIPTEWFVKVCDNPCVLLLDELDRASQQVIQGVFELALDRSIQGKKIHPETRVVVCINGGPDGANYQVNQLDPALLDRFWTMDLKPTTEEWLSWADKSGINKHVVEFIRQNRNLLETQLGQENPEEVCPSRRSWTRLAKVLSENETLIPNRARHSGGDVMTFFISFCSGFVGPAAANTFDKYVGGLKMYSADDITVPSKWKEVKKLMEKESLETHNDLLEKLKEDLESATTKVWDKKSEACVIEFFNVLPREVQGTFWEKVLSCEAYQSPVQKDGDTPEIDKKVPVFSIANALAPQLVELFKNSADSLGQTA